MTCFVIFSFSFMWVCPLENEWMRGRGRWYIWLYIRWWLPLLLREQCMMRFRSHLGLWHFTVDSSSVCTCCPELGGFKTILGGCTYAPEAFYVNTYLKKLGFWIVGWLLLLLLLLLSSASCSSKYVEKSCSSVSWESSGQNIDCLHDGGIGVLTRLWVAAAGLSGSVADLHVSDIPSLFTLRPSCRSPYICWAYRAKYCPHTPSCSDCNQWHRVFAACANLGFISDNNNNNNNNNVTYKAQIRAGSKCPMSRVNVKPLQCYSQYFAN